MELPTRGEAATQLAAASTDVEHEDFARLCLDPRRLAALGQAALGTLRVDGVMESLGISRRDALALIGDLRAAGLVDADGELNRQALRAIARTLPGPEEPAPHILEGEWTEDEVRVLRTFFAGERLSEIPTHRAKRRIVLERLAQAFEPGERYSEAEVSRHVEQYHPDYAALRRYLVDEGILSRAEGTYWRSGGRFPLEDGGGSESSGETKHPPRLALETSRPDVILVSYDAISPEALALVANDEGITRFMTDTFPQPYTHADAEQFLAVATAHDPPRHFAVLVDDEQAGGAGCDPHEGINKGVAEIGWWLNPAFWGRGIAAIAVGRLIEYCFEGLNLHRVEAGVFLTNTASTRVAEKAGLVLEGVARDAYLKDGRLIDRLSYGLARSSLEDADSID